MASIKFLKHCFPKIAPTHGQLLLQQNYATLVVENNKNQAFPSGDALKNNPPITIGGKVITHKQAHRLECDTEEDCKDKHCTTLCGTLKETKAVGHFTHGTPTVPQGKVVNLGSPDMSGNANKKQNIVVYNDAHTSSPTLLDANGTTYVNHSHVATTIIKHADKK